MFFKYGVKSVSIDDICNEIHISKKSFYGQFHQKSDLVAEFLERIRLQKLKEHQAILESDNIVEFLIGNFKRLAVPSVMDKHTAMYFDLEKYYPELYHEHLDKKDANSVDFAVEVLNRGVAQGLIRNDLDMDMSAFFMTQAFNYMFSAAGSAWTNTRKATFLVDMFMRFTCTPKGLEIYLSNK